MPRLITKLQILKFTLNLRPFVTCCAHVLLLMSATWPSPVWLPYHRAVLTVSSYGATGGSFCDKKTPTRPPYFCNILKNRVLACISVGETLLL